MSILAARKVRGKFPEKNLVRNGELFLKNRLKTVDSAKKR